jgi:type III secretory pathway component EscS
LWLSLLLKSVKNRAIYKAVFVLFVVSDLLIFFFDRILAFSCLAFVFGAFVYLIIFIVESFYELQREAFSFSFKSIFVVVCAGIIFYWA